MANGVYWLPTVVANEKIEIVGGGPWPMPGVLVVLLAKNEVSPAKIVVVGPGVPLRLPPVVPVGPTFVPLFPAIVVVVGPGVPPRLPPVVPVGPTFVPLFPLLLWELLCCVPPTAPPTTPPIIRMMMMTIVVMPHLVRYHGAFFATRLPFSVSPSLRASATAPGL